MKRSDLAGLVTACCFLAFSVSAQQKTESRFMRYSRNTQNLGLYDTADPYSFYNRVLRVTEDAFHGMPAAAFAPVREAYNGSVPGMAWKFSLQEPWPIMNVYGEDSIQYLPDGTMSYVYAVPDSLFYVNGAFDDVVIEEQLLADAASGKQSWKPQRVFLRKCLSGVEEPQVIRSFDWERLFDLFDWYTPLPPALSDSLGKALEQFLAEGERRFGGYEWGGQLNRFGVFEETATGKRIGQPEEGVDSEWQVLRASGEENGVFERTYAWEKPFTDMYGEDSVQYTASGEPHTVTHSGVDTVLYVKFCFGQLYALRYMSYSEGRWQESFGVLTVTKSAWPGGKQFAVYSVDGSANNEYSRENRAQLDYMNKQDPLKNFVRDYPVTKFSAFSWQQLDGGMVFSGEPVANP